MSGLGNVGAGHTLGRYELLAPIALGGMASVWAARMVGGVFQKIVAVKLMRSELSDDTDFEQMFLDEAAVVSHIRHPNVVEILDLGEEDGTLYQVMEWVDGEPINIILRESRAHGGIPLPIVLRIIKQVCAGLHAAHELRGPDGSLVGVVHRDVSPQNIMVGYDGIVKVLDFGVAKAALNKQTTRVGSVKGRVPYMSPEQARGERIDRRSDIFALGTVLYQMLTGKHPFQGQIELETMRRISTGLPPEPPRSLVPALPPEIEAIVLRALAPTPDQRFSTMLEMLRALEAATPPAAQIGAEEVVEYMRAVVGARGERRRAAIREAVQIAQGERPQTSRRSSLVLTDPGISSSPELEAIVQAAAAAAQGRPPAVVSQPPPPPPPQPSVRRAQVSPWLARAQELRRARLAVFGGVALALVLVLVAVVAFSRAGTGAPPAVLLSTRGALLHAARAAAAAATPPPTAEPPAPPPASTTKQKRKTRR